MEKEANFTQIEQLKPRLDIPQIEISSEPLEEDLPNVLWVDFDNGEDEGIKSAGFETYVISPVTQKNLFSDKYLNCTGVLGMGRDKETGQDIAFISHQNPEFFVNKGEEATSKFAGDLQDTLRELFSRSEDGTIEVVLFGGNIDTSEPDSKKTVDYKKSIEVLNGIVSSVLGHKPIVLSGPSRDGGAIDITVLTKKRQVFVER